MLTGSLCSHLRASELLRDLIHQKQSTFANAIFLKAVAPFMEELRSIARVLFKVHAHNFEVHAEFYTTIINQLQASPH